ncbi:MAG TPA: hypothetical protein VF895_01645 [Gaiellaceae bacterium]
MNTGSAENIAVRDNPDELRYELLVDDDVVGEIRYIRGLGGAPRTVSEWRRP